MFEHQDYVFSGHFHHRQIKGNVIYTGNAFPHNFSDSWDDERGWMFLEWDKEPEFFAWPDAPKYRNVTLSSLLENPSEILLPKTNARISLDIDISYEEANFIKENFAQNYQIRDLALIPQKKEEHAQDVQGEVIFESVDQIVTNQLAKIESDSFENAILVELYNRL